MTRTFRYSEIRRFQRCRRSWYNGYHLGLRLPEFDGERKPGKQHNGTLVHADLEAYYNGETAAPGDYHRQQAAPESEQFQKEWDEIYNLSQIMLDGYGEWLEEEGADQGEVTWGTEVEIDMPLSNDVTVQMHIDRIVHDPVFDRYIIEDTKTVDTLAKDVTFAMDWQLLTYALGAQRQLGLNIAECRHSMLRRVKRTARAKPPFYGRVSITPSEDQLKSQWAMLEGVTSDMVATANALDQGVGHHVVAYPNPTRDCSWDCDFTAICGMHDDGSDLSGVRNELYVRRDA